MKLLYSFAVIATFMIYVECGHTFMGNNFLRPLVYHKEVNFSPKIRQQRIEYINFTMPSPNYRRVIEGILAYDLTHSGASANVTQGGIGFNFVNLRMKSDRGSKINYDVYIYA